MPIRIRTVGDMRKALSPFKDSDVIDADYEFKLKDILDDLDEFNSPEDTIHQEFSLICPKQDNRLDDLTIVTLKLELEHETMGMESPEELGPDCGYHSRNKDS